MSYNLNVINEDWVIPNSNFKYVKSSGIVDLIVDFPIESKNFKKSNPSADAYVQFSFTADQGQVIEFVDVFNFTDNFSIDKLYAYGNLLRVKFLSIDIKNIGDLNFTITVTVKNKIGESAYETIETKEIIGKVTISANAGALSHNLETVNFANDDLSIIVDSTIAYLFQTSSVITYLGVEKSITLEDFFINNVSKISLKSVFQPHIYITEEMIDEYFSDFKLNIEPASVTLIGKFLNEKFETLQTVTIGTFNFFAGKKEKLPKESEEINRSMNFNTYLALPYEYKTQDIKIEFNTTEKIINKQALSTPESILQLLFSQRSNAFQKNKQASFSSGFNNGFATEESIAAAKTFYSYKEGQVNKISSYYTVIGYNFPWQKQAFTIVWLDENNIFRSLPLTGEITGEKQYKNFLNENAEDPNHYKAGNTMKDVRKMNTGFILSSETSLVLDLQKSKKAWLFADDPSERIFCVSVNSKIADTDTRRDLIQYDLDLEFYEK